MNELGKKRLEQELKEMLEKHFPVAEYPRIYVYSREELITELLGVFSSGFDQKAANNFLGELELIQSYDRELNEERKRRGNGPEMRRKDELIVKLEELIHEYKQKLIDRESGKEIKEGERVATVSNLSEYRVPKS